MRELACLLADRSDPFTETVLIELSDVFASVRLLGQDDPIPPCALLVIDLDYAPHAPAGERRIGYSRTERALPFPHLLRPFPVPELRRLLLLREGDGTLVPSGDFRTVTVSGETVALTEREASLLRLLYLADGELVGTETLAAVFPDAEEPRDVLGVYIHYLRKKLERDGRRRLRAKRGVGYSLDRG